MDFLVHNGSRTKTNRALRARSPEHGGFKHYVFNNTQRLISARPLLVTEEKLPSAPPEPVSKRMILLAIVVGILGVLALVFGKHR